MARSASISTPEQIPSSAAARQTRTTRIRIAWLVTINNIHLTSLVPTQDFIQEFKVQINNSPPEFGRFSGGVINLFILA